jgi:hypothetical protein
MADGKPVDPTWGDLDDVSEYIMKRHSAFKSKEAAKPGSHGVIL